jgi:hypothetical protein
MRGRVILKLFLLDVSDLPQKTTLAELEASLKVSLVPGDFLWEASLQMAFPKSDFWFLYGKL